MEAEAPSRETPDELAHALAQRGAWGAGAPEVEWVQTHISHVFLVGDRVYKLRKAVVLSFLDFGTRTARNADCVREVALNRRLAPTIYLGVAPVRVDADGVSVGDVTDSPVDPDAEHVVVMRRLTEGCDALSLLEQGRLGIAEVEAVADRLQPFHAAHGLGRPAPWSPSPWLERIAAPMDACLEAVAESGLVEAARMATVVEHNRARLAALQGAFEARRREGRAVDGHGDVHLDHVWFEPGVAGPLLIDCIEFSDELRFIDVAAEIAFAAMDLRYRGNASLADAILAAYAMRADDYGLFEVVDWFVAYRAMVRAKVAAIAAAETEIAAAQRELARGSVERHFALAASLLEEPSRGALVLMCGTVGTGKSTVARRLAALGGGVPIVSDRVRKALAGIAPTERTGAEADAGIYGAEMTQAVYDGLLERAAPVIASGRTAILDASFARRAQREAVQSWAAAHGVASRLIEVRCDPEMTRARLRERERAGTDPSDAGPGFLARSRARFEPPNEWPAADRAIVASDDERDLERALLELGG